MLRNICDKLWMCLMLIGILGLIPSQIVAFLSVRQCYKAHYQTTVRSFTKDWLEENSIGGSENPKDKNDTRLHNEETSDSTLDFDSLDDESKLNMLRSYKLYIHKSCDGFLMAYFITITTLELVCICIGVPMYMYSCISKCERKLVKKLKRKPEIKVKVINSPMEKCPPRKRNSKKRISIANENLQEVTETNDPVTYLQIVNIVSSTWKDDKTSYGKDAKGMTHSRIKIRKIYTLVNDRKFDIYDAQYRQIELNQTDIPDVDTLDIDIPEVHSSNSRDTKDNVSVTIEPEETNHLLSKAHHFDELRKGEAYLFHGTPVRNIQSILANGFDLDRSRRGLYGHPRIYLADSSQKADQYADRNGERRKKNLAMLLVRTALGKVHLYQDDPEMTSCDTVLAGNQDKRFREFVKNKSSEVYPEFLILYDRKN